MLTQRQTLTIGVLTPQALSVIFSNPFFGAFSEGVAIAAEEHGYALHFISPLHGALARAMGRATVDGVVAIGLSDDHPEVEQIRRAGVPIVLVDSTALPDHGSIEVDDVGGARAAAEHVIGLGHRDVLIIGVEPPAPSTVIEPGSVTRPPPARLSRGVRGGRRRPSPTSASSSARPASTAASPRSTTAWEAGHRPTAVLAMSDAMAIGAMRALRDLGPHRSRRRQRRRLRRHRSRPARRPAADDGPPTDPSQGRGGGPPAPDRRPATRPGHARAPAARDAAHRPRLDGPGPSRSRRLRDAPASMSVDTPAWVRDAIFYQIFPDRFAASDRVPKPGVLEPWDAPPTNSRVQGRRPARHRRAPRLPRGPRGHRDLPDADLPVGVEPPLPHVRLLRGRSPAGRRRGPPRAARPRPRPRDAGRPRRRLQPHRPRVLAVPPHPRDRRRVAVPRLVPARAERLDAGRPLLAYPPPGTPRSALGYEAWWGLPALPKLNTDEPEVREYLLSVAEHWLRFGIDGWRLDVPQEIDDEAFWQEFRRRCRAIRSDAYLVGEIWGVAPDWLRGDRFDALMNYPLGEAILGFAGGPLLDMASSAATTSTPGACAAGRPGFADRVPSSRRPTTRTSSRSSSTSSARTMHRGCGRSWAATARASGWRRCSR